MDKQRFRSFILVTGILCFLSINFILTTQKSSIEIPQTKHDVNATPCVLSTAKSSTSSKSTVAFASEEWVERMRTKIEPRIWKVREDPLPCYPPQRLTWKDEFAPLTKPTDPHPRQFIPPETRVSGTGGMFFVKPMKVGGSTAAGVHLRIMHSQAKKQTKSFPACRGNFRHGDANIYGSVKSQSMLWAVVRDPTARAISQFFHYYVSRGKVEPTDNNFRQALLEGGAAKEKGMPKENAAPVDPITPSYPSESYYSNLLRLNLQNRPLEDSLASILSTYDFIAVTERLDESFVVMKHLWGLDWGDILYLSAKKHGGFDDGGAKNGCTWIVPSFVTDSMKDFFSGKPWLSHIKWDFSFYVAVNASLDLTIDKVVGRDRFEQDLRMHRHYLSLVNDECAPKAIFPCSGEKRRKDNVTNCLWSDSACANDCVDTIAARIAQK